MSKVNADVQRVIDDLLGERESLHVLEAGCGSTSHVRFGEGARLTGIDISKDQLDRNSHLGEKIVGDLETYPLPDDHYDAIVCWDVLEHLPNPELALNNFSRALKPGGVLVLAMPAVFSLKGLVAKLTPFWFHVWFYRTIMGDRSAGTSHFRQFPTYLRFSIAPGAVRRYAERKGLGVRHFVVYEGPVQRDFRLRHAWADLMLRAMDGCARAVTLGRAQLLASDYVVVLQREPRVEPAREAARAR